MKIHDAFVDTLHFGFRSVILHDVEKLLVDEVIFWRVGFKEEHFGAEGESFAATTANFDASRFGFVGGGDNTTFFADAISYAERLAAK